MLPTPPQEAIQAVGPNMIQLPTPKITMTSRLALALRSITMRASDDVMQTAVVLAPVDPSVMDHLNTGYYIREKSRLAGCDPQMLKPLEEVAAIQQARAQAQQAQAAAMMAKEAAGAVKDVGGIEKVGELMGA